MIMEEVEASPAKNVGLCSTVLSARAVPSARPALGSGGHPEGAQGPGVLLALL